MNRNVITAACASATMVAVALALGGCGEHSEREIVTGMLYPSTDPKPQVDPAMADFLASINRDNDRHGPDYLVSAKMIELKQAIVAHQYALAVKIIDDIKRERALEHAAFTTEIPPVIVPNPGRQVDEVSPPRKPGTTTADLRISMTVKPATPATSATGVGVSRPAPHPAPARPTTITVAVDPGDAPKQVIAVDATEREAPRPAQAITPASTPVPPIAPEQSPVPAETAKAVPQQEASTAAPKPPDDKQPDPVAIVVEDKTPSVADAPHHAEPRGDAVAAPVSQRSEKVKVVIGPDVIPLEDGWKPSPGRSDQPKWFRSDAHYQLVRTPGTGNVYTVHEVTP